MTYRRRSKDDRKDAGIILADALLGIGLAAAFAAITSSALLEAQAMMERAERRAALLDAYEANAGAFVGMMPYEDRSIDIPASASTGSMRIDARARLYGNDRIETDIRAKEGGISLELAAVRAYPFASMEETAGRPLCSVDMMRRGEIAHIDPIRLPIDPLLPLTDLEVRDGRAYVSTDSAHAADPDFLIFDIRHPGAAAILSQIDTGPGISEVAIAGRYAYAAAASAAAQLHVIRIDAPDQISLVAKYSLPLPASSTPPTRGSAIAYMKGAVLLGTEKWDGDELDIIDVSSPAAPVKITGAETGSKVGSIYVDRLRSRAYAAAAGQEQLRTYDISSLPAIGLAGSFSPSGWERQEGRTIERFEDELAFGRTSGGFDIQADHEAFAWASTSEQGSFSAMNVPGGVYGIVADRRHIYLATRTADSELSIYPPDLSTSTGSLSLPVAPQALACDSDRLYVLARSAPYIYEIHFEPS